MRLRLLVLAALLVLVPSVKPAVAQSADRRKIPTQGSLVAKGADAKLIDLPLEHTDVKAEVTGAVARVTVRQTFGNPFDDPPEQVANAIVAGMQGHNGGPRMTFSAAARAISSSGRHSRTTYGPPFRPG